MSPSDKLLVDFVAMRASIFSYLGKIGGKFDSKLKASIVYDYIRSNYQNTTYFCKYMALSRASFYRWLEKYKDKTTVSVEELDAMTVVQWEDPDEVTSNELEAIQKALMGEPLSKIAKKYNIQLRRLRQLAVESGWDRSLTKYEGSDKRKKRDKDMARMRREGKTLAQIGDKYGISRERVRQAIDKDGSIKKELMTKRQAERDLEEQVHQRILAAKKLAEQKRKLDFMLEWNRLPIGVGLRELDKLCMSYGYASYLSASVSINKFRHQGYPFLLRWDHTASDLNKLSIEKSWEAFKKTQQE